MRSLQCLAIALCLASSVARADDKAGKPAAKEPAAKKTAGKGDPSGTWTWTFQGPNGQSFEQTATFQVAGDKLTGNVSGRRGEAPISEGSFKDGKVTFAVIRERDGRKMTARYEGKVEGDAIKGTSKVSRGDGERTVPWEAKRK